MYLAYQIASCCPDVQSVTAAAVDIPVAVKLDAIGNSYVASGEDSPISQKVAAVAIDYVEGIDRMRIAVVWRLRARACKATNTDRPDKTLSISSSTGTV